MPSEAMLQFDKIMYQRSKHWPLFCAYVSDEVAQRWGGAAEGWPHGGYVLFDGEAHEAVEYMDAPMTGVPVYNAHPRKEPFHWNAQPMTVYRHRYGIALVVLYVVWFVFHAWGTGGGGILGNDGYNYESTVSTQDLMFALVTFPLPALIALFPWYTHINPPRAAWLAAGMVAVGVANHQRQQQVNAQHRAEFEGWYNANHSVQAHYSGGWPGAQPDWQEQQARWDDPYGSREVERILARSQAQRRARMWP